MPISKLPVLTDHLNFLRETKSPQCYVKKALTTQYRPAFTSWQLTDRIQTQTKKRFKLHTSQTKHVISQDISLSPPVQNVNPWWQIRSSMRSNIRPFIRGQWQEFLNLSTHENHLESLKIPVPGSPYQLYEQVQKFGETEISVLQERGTPWATAMRVALWEGFQVIRPGWHPQWEAEGQMRGDTERETSKETDKDRNWWKQRDEDRAEQRNRQRQKQRQDGRNR